MYSRTWTVLFHRSRATLAVGLLCLVALLSFSASQEAEIELNGIDLPEDMDHEESEITKMFKQRMIHENTAAGRDGASPSVLKLESDHLKAIGFSSDEENVCLREITLTANNSDIWKVVSQYGGWIGVRAGPKKIKQPPKSRSYLTDKDMDFLESSWCNRNGQWSTYAFVGPRIIRPEKEMTTIDEWRQDIHETMAQTSYDDRRVIYLATVPSILRAENAPNHFFYNTHWFTVQLVPSRTEPEKGHVRIYAGFARHYRIVDYLAEWPINAQIPSTHRLKMDRTTWAGTDIPLERFTGEFMDKSDQFMKEINEKMEWTRTANDLHAELWYADKFKDMVILDRARRKAAKENATDTASFAVADSSVDPTMSHETMTVNVPYYERWRIPLTHPSDGKGYHYEIRKYHYTYSDCVKYSREMRSRVYGFSWKPAKPFKMALEDYDTIDGIEANSQSGNHQSD